MYMAIWMLIPLQVVITATEFVYQKLFMAYAWEPYGGYILYKYKV